MKQSAMLHRRQLVHKDALAVACAALRINGAYLKDTRRFSCEENLTQFANKELVKFAFEQRPGMLPMDFIRPVPTEEDYAQVAEIQKWMKRYIMLGLGELDDFKKDMIATVSQDTVKFSQLRSCCIYSRICKTRQARKRIKERDPCRVS